MSKHTPGPWFAQAGYLTIYNLSDGNVGTTCGIAKVLRDQPGDDQAEANARLIAAAPELLDALTRMLKQFPADSDLYAAGWDGSAINEACDAYDAARAAVRKATGEE